MKNNFERMDLIRKLSEIRSHYNCFNEKERQAYHTLSEAIEALQEPKPGKWVDCIDNRVVCSVCVCRQDIKAKFLFSYCPNCGANMRNTP